MNQPFTNYTTKSEYIQRKKNLYRANFLKTQGSKNYQNRNFKTSFSADLSRNKFIYFKNNGELLEQTKALVNDAKYCNNPIIDSSKTTIFTQRQYVHDLYEANNSSIDMENPRPISTETAQRRGIFQRRGILTDVKKKICFKIHSKYR